MSMLTKMSLLRYTLVCAVISICSFTAFSQVRPANYDTLNYRLVGFEVPEHKVAKVYELEVFDFLAQDDGNIETLVVKKMSRSNRFIEVVPEFGRHYRWRVKYKHDNRIIDSTDFHYFSTGYFSYTDPAKYRARVLENKIDNKYLYVFEDATRALYDMQGNAVWYLPNIPDVVDDNTSIRDIKITPFHTITFLTLKEACEIDYDGNLLWKAPDDGKVSGDSSEHYHHEFTRLSNGNYMVAGIKTVPREIPENFVVETNKDFARRETGGRGERFFISGGKKYENVQFGTLIEYDSSGNIRWSWNSGDYFTDDDIFRFFTDSSLRSRTHLNAFYFNEKEKTIYTSYRNIHRIMKTAYPSGKLLANYGEVTVSGENISGNGMFYGQHSCKLSKDGHLYLFNNNNTFHDTNLKKISSIVLLTEPGKKEDTLQKYWEFTCDIDTLASPFTAGGGGVSELNDKSMLVCMASSRSFIVSKSKEVLWNMLIEFYTSDMKWEQIGNGYRCSAIEAKPQLEQLIFNQNLVTNK